jgi:hypothetical protein
MKMLRFVGLSALILMSASSALGDSKAEGNETLSRLTTYKPDVFQPREVEACAMTHVLGAIPVRGGRVWLFDGEGGTTLIECSKVPKLPPSPLPRSILLGTEMENWKLGSDKRMPETVQLRDGIPHRVVQAWAIGPKGKLQTEAPCQEMDPAVLCEGSEGGEFVAATRQLEAIVRAMEALLSQKKYGEFREIIQQFDSDQLTKVANEGQQAMDSGAFVKTSEANRQSKKDFEKRIGRVLDRLGAALEAYIAAKQAEAGS